MRLWKSSPAYVEDFAKFLAERINGGEFYNKTFYNDEQRQLWKDIAVDALTYLVTTEEEPK